MSILLSASGKDVISNTHFPKRGLLCFAKWLTRSITLMFPLMTINWSVGGFFCSSSVFFTAKQASAKMRNGAKYKATVLTLLSCRWQRKSLWEGMFLQLNSQAGMEWWKPINIFNFIEEKKSTWQLKKKKKHDLPLCQFRKALRVWKINAALGIANIHSFDSQLEKEESHAHILCHWKMKWQIEWVVKFPTERPGRNSRHTTTVFV